MKKTLFIAVVSCALGLATASFGRVTELPSHATTPGLKEAQAYARLMIEQGRPADSMRFAYVAEAGTIRVYPLYYPTAVGNPLMYRDGLEAPVTSRDSKVAIMRLFGV